MICPLHNSFARSLRKYERNTSKTRYDTNSIPRKNSSSRSSTFIKPFHVVEEDSQQSKRSPPSKIKKGKEI